MPNVTWDKIGLKPCIATIRLSPTSTIRAQERSLPNGERRGSIKRIVGPLVSHEIPGLGARQQTTTHCHDHTLHHQGKKIVTAGIPAATQPALHYTLHRSALPPVRNSPHLAFAPPDTSKLEMEGPRMPPYQVRLPPTDKVAYSSPGKITPAY
jgi:hypothetical protein